MPWQGTSRVVFTSDERGNVTVMVSLILTVLLGFVGLGVDASSWYSLKRGMQTAVDSAAMAAAYELSRSPGSISAAIAAAEDAASRNGFSSGLDVQLIGGGTAVEATLNVVGKQYLSQLFLQTPPTLGASAAARMTRASICLLALEPEGQRGLQMKATAKITSPGCRIQVNSAHEEAVLMQDNSSIEALSVCVTGGVTGSSNISPRPDAGCPPAADPLSSLQPPTFSPSNCSATDKVISGNATLAPGVYCSGLELRDDAQVTLDPGIYVITDDKFTIKDQAELHGDGVVIYLHGDNATIEAEGTGKIFLTAPRTGPFAGVIFFQDRNANPSNQHRFRKSIEKHYEGTIYLPPGIVEFTG